MSHEFHELSVSGITQETKDCVSITLECTEGNPDLFNFKQGQHLTIIHPKLGEDVKRSYSICSAPWEKTLKIACKKVESGVFSTFLNDELLVGQKLMSQIPEGRFYTKLEASNQKQYVFFSAGSGITPVISIIKQILFEEPLSSVLLFYGNQKSEQVIFLEELMGLKNIYPDRLSLHFILSKEELEESLYNGRINKEKLQEFCRYFFKPNEVDEYFMCGPETMLLELREALIGYHVDPKKIHLELFGIEIIREAPKSTHHKPGETCHVRITLDGRTFEYPLAYNSVSILDSALQQGARLPFACKGGVCCTCKAKLLKGEVDMLVNYGLEPDELENGYILSCQSFPKTETIELSFDE